MQRWADLLYPDIHLNEANWPTVPLTTMLSERPILGRWCNRKSDPDNNHISASDTLNESRFE